MPTFLSEKGLQDLKDEHVKRKAKRKEISEAIADAKELGDLSENFEYHAAKEEQALNETRIAQLETMIQDVVLVEEQKGGDIVTLGVTFVVTLDGKDKTYEMVGSTEADPMSGKISNESPIGQAFMGTKLGDNVEVETPGGAKIYQIKEIH
jgi:transcription elongation factor GreA